MNGARGRICLSGRSPAQGEPEPLCRVNHKSARIASTTNTTISIASHGSTSVSKHHFDERRPERLPRRDVVASPKAVLLGGSVRPKPGFSARRKRQ